MAICIFFHNHSLNAEKNGHYVGFMLDAPTIALCPKLCRHKVSNPNSVNVTFFLRTIGAGHCPFLLYRLFIASKNMSSQRTIFCFEKDILVNLNLTVFFILPRSRVIFQKFEG